MHWNGPRVYSRDPTRRICFNPTHDDIGKTEGLQFRQNKSVVDEVNGLGKVEVDNIMRATVRRTRRTISPSDFVEDGLL